jgi:hypothetical protein
MKKIIILIVAIAITGIVSAQVTFTSNLFQQNTVQVNAKSHIELTIGGADSTNFTLGTICQQEAIVIKVWQRALQDDGTSAFADPVLSGNATLTTAAVKTSPATSVPNVTPAYSSYICGTNWAYYEFTIPAGAVTTPGDYIISLDRAEGGCGTGSTNITFTIGQPQVPVIAVNGPICEDGDITLSVTWHEEATPGNWSSAVTPNTNDVVVTYVVEDLTCGSAGTWVNPSTVGLTSPITVPSAGLTFPVDEPGRKNLHINSVSYTKTGCGTITINNTVQH